MEVKEQSQIWVNRRQRRAYLRKAGVLRAKSKLRFSDWCNVVSNNIKNGKQRHEKFQETVLKGIETQLEACEQRIRLTCNKWGYTKEQTDEHIENWIESLKPWPNR